MSNFSFLNDKSEFSSFADACIHAEELFKDSPNSSVTTSRKALENIVKFIYANNANLRNLKLKGQSLFDLMDNPSFQTVVPKRLHINMHKIRQLGNDILHNNHQVSKEQSILCLRALFEIVQWVDKKYGKNYTPRSFDESCIPKNTSGWVNGLKGAAAAVVTLVVGKAILDNKRF